MQAQVNVSPQNGDSLAVQASLPGPIFPGFVQPHGVLLVLDAQGAITHRSRGAAESLAGLGRWEQGLPCDLWCADARLHTAIWQALDSTAGSEGDLPSAIELTLPGGSFDVLVHASDQRVLVEFERRTGAIGDAAAFASLAHSSVNRLKRLRSVDALLGEAVVTLRKLTGFDRVTAYRFRHDESAEVVAEDRCDALEGFAGMRFLPTDIPAYARTLFTLNTLRLITDVDDLQVPVEAVSLDARPLDLSRAVLRSVSPLHAGYLKSLGVAASLSLSIVIEGQLWGAFACHHRTARTVPHAVRMTCAMLVQFVGATLLVAQEKAAVVRRSIAADLRSRLVDVALHADDVLEQFKPIGAEWQDAMTSDALLLMHHGKHVHEGLSPAGAVQLAGWLATCPESLVVLNELSTLPGEVRTSLLPHCALLAICFDRQQRGWMVLLRQEYVCTAKWNFFRQSGMHIVGPNDVWSTSELATVKRQTVRGVAMPWDDVDRALAYKLADELGRASLLRTSEKEDAYVQLMGMLGHDLRDPLQTISMVGQVLSRDDPASPLGQRIASSTGRMQRLITQVLDMSRLRSGNGLGISGVNCDMAFLVRGWVDETRFAYPSVTIELETPATLPACVDSDRMAQVLSNLVSNARHHGVIGEPIRVALTMQPTLLRMEVSNAAPPISADLIDMMFDPLKRISGRTLRNPGGLGLGLYIAREVAKGHGGTLNYSYDGTRVIFTMEIGLGTPSVQPISAIPVPAVT